MGNNLLLASIIIPIYNAAQHLNKCIESVLSQSYLNFELILIDDGSIDNSVNVCNEYANNDSRIKVISQSNSGVSKARDIGVRNASGQWIVFIDSDDQLLPNGLRQLMNLASSSDYDIIKASFVGYPIKRQWKNKIVGVLSKSEYVTSLINGDVLGVVYAGAYKKVLFNDNSVIDDPTLKVGEDILLNIILANRLSKVFVCNEYVYQYNDVEGSAMNKYIVHPKYYFRFFERMRKDLYYINELDLEKLFLSVDVQEKISVLRSAYNPRIQLDSNDWYKIKVLSRFKNSKIFDFRIKCYNYISQYTFIGKSVKFIIHILFKLHLRLFYKHNEFNKIIIK